LQKEVLILTETFNFSVSLAIDQKVIRLVK